MGRPWAWAIGVLLALLGCRADPVPDELIRVWRSEAPAYRERHLEVRKDMLVFGTSPLISELYPIEDIDSEPAEAGTHYTIHYRAQDGARLKLDVVLTRGSRAALRIDHIDHVWYADAGSNPQIEPELEPALPKRPTNKPPIRPVTRTATGG